MKRSPADVVWEEDEQGREVFWGVDTTNSAVMWVHGGGEVLHIRTKSGFAEQSDGPVQFVPLRRGLLRGDPGKSLQTGRPVIRTLLPRLRNTPDPGNRGVHRSHAPGTRIGHNIRDQRGQDNRSDYIDHQPGGHRHTRVRHRHLLDPDLRHLAEGFAGSVGLPDAQCYLRRPTAAGSAGTHTDCRRAGLRDTHHARQHGGSMTRRISARRSSRACPKGVWSCATPCATP